MRILERWRFNSLTKAKYNVHKVTFFPAISIGNRFYQVLKL